MKLHRFKTALLAVILGMIFYRTIAFADVDKVCISQIVQNGNDVYLYVNAMDASGNPVSDTFSKEQFSVNIDNNEAISVQNAELFRNLNQGVSYIFCIDISKSVTEQEMEEIRGSIIDFVNGMSENDYIKIITIGSEITCICDSTNDPDMLKDAIGRIERSANNTYLYKGILTALDGQRKKVEMIPDRAAIILFTDGMDDSDGASSEEQVLEALDEIRIPVYVVGLKGQDSTANLNSVGKIARQSGGSVLSYIDRSIAESVKTIRDIMNDAYQLQIRPDDFCFGIQNLIWNVTYHEANYSVSSMNYIFSLGLDNVLLGTSDTEGISVLESDEAQEMVEHEEIGENRKTMDGKEPSEVQQVTENRAEADTDKKVETEQPEETERITEQKEQETEQTEARQITEKEQETEQTEARQITEKEQETEQTEARQTTEKEQKSEQQETAVKEPATEHRKSNETEQSAETQAVTEVQGTEENVQVQGDSPKEEGTDQITKLLQDNLIICIASGLVFLALIIIIVSLLRRNKRKKENYASKRSFSYGNSPAINHNNHLDEEFTYDNEKTVDEVDLYDDEKTIDEVDPYDDEATVDGTNDNGLRIGFEITFYGQTEILERVLREQLILGRGDECDVDVVLHSTLEERKQTSRKHAFIIERPDGLYVKDNSRNKTYLNGVEVEGEAMLRDEDVLQLGKATVKVKILGY